MSNGISIYPGLDNTPLENLKLLQDAARAGITRVFTSLQIPESDSTALKAELGSLLGAAREHHMEVITDVSPATRELLGIRDFSLSAFRILGITTLRLDYGFGIEEIVRLSRNTQGMRIQLNASTMTGAILSGLIEGKANFHQIDALHNFYPRKGTGLAEDSLVRQNLMLQHLGMKVGAFVPSQGRRRSPLKDGLPTLEEHRTKSADFAARHLLAMGTDSVFIGDSLPTPEELQAIGGLKAGEVVLSAKLLTKDETVKSLLSHPFTSRLDAARDAIRAQESRPLLKKTGHHIAPENTVRHTIGDITLDNEGYGRYMGELEIIRREQDADPRTNVVARVDTEDLALLPYITPGKKFSFRFHA